MNDDQLWNKSNPKSERKLWFKYVEKTIFLKLIFTNEHDQRYNGYVLWKLIVDVEFREKSRAYNEQQTRAILAQLKIRIFALYFWFEPRYSLTQIKRHLDSNHDCLWLKSWPNKLVKLTMIQIKWLLDSRHMYHIMISIKPCHF